MTHSSISVQKQAFAICNSSGDVVRGDLRFAAEGKPRPVVIICHGFNTNKDWGPFPFCGEWLAGKGFATVLFNFSHNGLGKTNGVFSDYDRFSRNTPGKELEDVQAVLRAVTEGELGADVIGGNTIGMAGHSRGAAISVLTAASDRRVGSVVAWSTVESFLRVTEDERERWIKTGFHPLRYGSSRTLLRYHVSVLNDMETNRRCYDIPEVAAALSVPTLFLHGSEDEIVDAGDARRVFERIDGSRREFHLIDGAGHTYGTEHPFAGPTPHLMQMLEKTADWFHKTISQESL